jgi:putative heme iron utilization protein
MIFSPNPPAPPITPRGLPIPEGAGIPYDAGRLARELLRSMRAGALSTIDSGSGYPFGSVTNIATDQDGSPIFIMAWRALHTRNVHADNRVSLILADLGRGNALAQPRLTLVGRAVLVEDGQTERVKRRYLARHPKAELYTTLPDVRFYKLEIEDLQLSGGPNRNWASLTAADLLTDVGNASALAAAEAAEIERLNAAPDTLQKLVVTAGGKVGRWRATGIDPEGVDLAFGNNVLRFWFSKPAHDVAELWERITEAIDVRPGLNEV